MTVIRFMAQCYLDVEGFISECFFTYVFLMKTYVQLFQ
jgi:hypothetical protein